MRVFVLGTGRCGTTTFIRACEHLHDFTSGHETRGRSIGDERLDYPDQHIEADNRLSWMLGPLGERFDGTDVLYVHLRRRRGEVIDSFARRWDSPHRTNILKAFAHGIIMRPSDWPDDRVLDVCAYYVDVVTSNIEVFLRGRRAMEMWLHELPETFVDFVDAIGGTGDIDRACAELAVRHNASPADL